MPLPILCDEHIRYEIIRELGHRGIDAISVQQIGLDATDDSLIMTAAYQQGRVIYTGDDDFLRLADLETEHLGVFCHHPDKYSIGEAIRAVELACQVLSPGEMRNRVEFL